jgi:hypothetical protein
MRTARAEVSLCSMPHGVAVRVRARNWVDYPVQAPDGAVHFDYPERIPEHAKRAVRRLFKKLRKRYGRKA